jgi:hypothetical protein
MAKKYDGGGYGEAVSVAPGSWAVVILGVIYAPFNSEPEAHAWAFSFGFGETRYAVAPFNEPDRNILTQPVSELVINAARMLVEVGLAESMREAVLIVQAQRKAKGLDSE